jgi:hypothetical protein
MTNQQVIRKVMIAVPTEIADSMCVNSTCSCRSCLEHIYENLETIPHIVMKLIGNKYYCDLDRKCPCDCPDRYYKFYFDEQDLDDWLRNNRNLKIIVSC